MAKAKSGRTGRPTKPERRDVSVKYPKTLAGMARLVSQAKGLTMAEYLELVSRAAIEADYGRLMEAFRLRSEEGEAR